MYWLHCNGCYRQPDPGVALTFHITNCSHIYCEKCVNECTKDRCKVCQSKCASLELSGKLQKEVESLFDDPTHVAEKAVKQLNRTLEFQKSHQRRWCRHLKEMLRQQGQQFQEMKKLAGMFRSLEKESMDLKKENSYLKCLLAKSGLALDPNEGIMDIVLLYRLGCLPQDPGIRTSRGGSFQGASPNQSVFRRSPQQVMQMHQGNLNRSGASGSSVLNRPGRILMRTPPSEGKLGTIRSYTSYMTPESLDLRKGAPTPLSVPRPICLSQTE